MGLLINLIKSILAFILMVAYLIVAVGMLFVLRVVIDWFWDFDYVEWVKDHAGKNK